MTPSLSLLAAARDRPAAPALICDGRVFTFEELARQVSALVDELGPRLGHLRGQVPGVAFVARHRLETLLAVYALVELGIPFLPLHQRLTPAERARLIADARPAAVLDEDFRMPPPRAEPLRPASIDDRGPLAVLLTSGTTGRPKGAVLDRRAFLAAAAASALNLGWRPDDRWMLLLPVAHVGGLSILLRCLLARACVVTGNPVGPFDPAQVAEALERHRVTIVSLIPTMLRRLLDLRPRWQPPPGLRAVLLGGAAAPASLLEEAAARGVPALTTYGLTETCSQVTVQAAGSTPDPGQGAGRPLPGLELKIEEGEILVRGPTLLSAYLCEGALVDPRSPDGWLATGDHGRLDEEGRLHVLDRRTDLVVTGGENVYPAEVEGVLERCPGVAAACVFGVPDDLWGAIVSAAIVPDVSGSPDERTLSDWVRERLAPHKRPRRVAFLPALPLTGAGKLDRGAVRALLAGRLRPLASGAGDPRPLEVAS